MESLVNYESDDGGKKYKKNKVHAKEHNKNDATTGSSQEFRAKHGRKRKGSSDDSDSSDADSHIQKSDSSRQDLSKESNQSPKRSSAKNNLERDSGKSDGKRRKDDRSEKKKDRHDSRERDRGRDHRSHSKGYDDRHHHKEKHRAKNKYDKRDRDDVRNRNDRNDRHDKRRRNDVRKSSSRITRNEYDRNRDGKKEEHNNGGASNRIHSPKNQRDNHYGGDCNWRKNSPSSSYQSDKQQSVIPTSSNQCRPHHDDKDSRTKFAIQKAEAISRNIERRANEKVYQLQKLGIEVPGITVMQQQQMPLIQQPLLMAQNTHIRFGALQPTSTVTSQESASTLTGVNNDNNGGINLTNFTSPVLVNSRYTDQMQKKKLIWGAKKAAAEQADSATTTNKWETAKFSQDNDGKMASKFLRLMGMKNAAATQATKSDDSSEDTASVDPSVRERQEMFSTMEQQYEVARQTTHTMRGMGLGFGSSRPY